MTTETTFRMIALANLALCLPIGVYYRVRSQATREPLARREEGVFILVALRLCGVFGWVVIAAYLLDAGWVSRCSIGLPQWLRWAGAAVGVVLVPPLLFWTFDSLGKNLTDTVVTRREHTLVTHGPYRWVRHPFYDVVFLWALSLTLLTANWLFALIGPAFAALVVARTRIEEAKLAERFGDEYLSYARRTGKFVPRIGRRR
jgi:protein-S-isoprenylcysteine O-methyltransferase Ste14